MVWCLCASATDLIFEYFFFFKGHAVLRVIGKLNICGRHGLPLNRGIYVWQTDKWK